MPKNKTKDNRLKVLGSEPQNPLAKFKAPGSVAPADSITCRGGNVSLVPRSQELNCTVKLTATHRQTEVQG